MGQSSSTQKGTCYFKKPPEKPPKSQHNQKFKMEIRHFLTVQGHILLGKGTSKSHFCNDAAKLYHRSLPSLQTVLTYSLLWEFGIVLPDGSKQTLINSPLHYKLASKPFPGWPLPGTWCTSFPGDSPGLPGSEGPVLPHV